MTQTQAHARVNSEVSEVGTRIKSLRDLASIVEPVPPRAAIRGRFLFGIPALRFALV